MLQALVGNVQSMSGVTGHRRMADTYPALALRGAAGRLAELGLSSSEGRGLKVHSGNEWHDFCSATPLALHSPRVIQTVQRLCRGLAVGSDVAANSLWPGKQLFLNCRLLSVYILVFNDGLQHLQEKCVLSAVPIACLQRHAWAWTGGYLRRTM